MTDAGRPTRPADGPSSTSRRRRRTDPTGVQSLFTAPVAAPRDQLAPGSRDDGRTALYSTGPRQTGTVVIECSGCTVRTRVSLLDLGIRLASISVWLPVRRHSHWLRCPSCHTHTWCHVGWTD